MRANPKVAALALLACLIGLASVAEPAHGDTFNEVVLQVNDEITTLFDFKQRYLTTELELRRQLGNEPEKLQTALQGLPNTVLASIFHEMLILSRGKQLGERVSEAEIDKEIRRRRELLQIATDEEFRERLARSGLTLETLRQNIREEVMIQLVMQQEVFNRIDLEEDDIRRVWRDNPEDYLIPEQRKLREVVVLEDGGLSGEQMEQVSLQLRKRLATETDPETILADYEERKITSGIHDLGWIPKGDLDSALEEAVQQLQPGEVSPPVVARGGLHVIHLLDRQQESVQPFDEVKGKIFAAERNRLYERELPRYLKELEEQSFIVAHPPPGAEEFREQADRATEEADPLAAFKRPTAGATEPTPAPEPPKAPATGDSDDDDG